MGGSREKLNHTHTLDIHIIPQSPDNYYKPCQRITIRLLAGLRTWPVSPGLLTGAFGAFARLSGNPAAYLFKSGLNISNAPIAYTRQSNGSLRVLVSRCSHRITSRPFTRFITIRSDNKPAKYISSYPVDLSSGK